MNNNSESITELLNRINCVSCSCDNDMHDLFNRIAEELMCNYVLCDETGTTCYSLIEIEFYLYKQNVHEDTVVYPRNCNAGQLFYHYSGADIAFQTITDDDNVTFGGILIRSMKKCDEIIGGPLRCKDELLNNGINRIIYHESPKQDIEKTTRYGINKDEKYSKALYRYYIPQTTWNRKKKNVLAYKHIDGKKVARITDVTEYYSNYPTKKAG